MPLASLPALADDLSAAAARLRRSTVAVLVGAPAGPGRAPPPNDALGHGSGVVWRADGVVVTNAHVARTERLTVVLPDGRRVAARVVAHDRRRDLAVLRAEAPLGDVDAAAVGDPEALRPGEVVLAFGHPLGLRNALAVGIVHGAPASLVRHRRGARQTHREPGVALVRADVQLLPGNSGGPLADARGRVVGINTMVVNGLGVAVSAREVEALLRETGLAGATLPSAAPRYAA